MKSIITSISILASLDEVGGEPLAGSGFEDETPDPEFTDAAPDAVAPRQ
jgi:hypothetical protein